MQNPCRAWLGDSDAFGDYRDSAFSSESSDFAGSDDSRGFIDSDDFIDSVDSDEFDESVEFGVFGVFVVSGVLPAAAPPVITHGCQHRFSALVQHQHQL